MLFTGNGSEELFINLPVAGINAAVADHFEMLFRDMADEARYELHNRKGYLHIGVIFVAVIVEGDKVTIIAVNPGRGDNMPPQIASNVFYGGFGITFWIPFQIPAKGVENHDETGSKVHGLIQLKEHTRNNAVYSMEETIKQGEV